MKINLFCKKAAHFFLSAILSISLLSWNIKAPHPDNELKLFKDYSFINNNNAKLTILTPYYAYDSLSLGSMGLSKKGFAEAVTGMQQMIVSNTLKNDSILTIVDFDQPSNQKRMYIIDVKNYKLLFNTWTAHGKNSGLERAQSFSNTDESNKSSLGFYITENPYNGCNGYSLKLKGLEKNINDHAYERAIVVHGADYVSQASIDAKGYIGRSHGCPAVPVALNAPIINTIKGGSCLFIFNSNYVSGTYNL